MGALECRFEFHKTHAAMGVSGDLGFRIALDLAGDARLKVTPSE
jgi:hypothetical protein